MAKYMSKELELIRDSLTCGHCSCIFQGSNSQAYKVKYENSVVYCSSTCRHAALRNKFSKSIPNRGPCKTCGKEFFSKTAKIYCSLSCYVNSLQFKDMLKAAQEKSRQPEVREKISNSLKKGVNANCLDCGEEFYQKRQAKGVSKKMFCSRACYRSYMTKRYDRWIANPKEMALPQCYDEFLNGEALECLVDGCGWSGRNLSMHLNFHHGISANDFKRATGFNLNTGLVTKDLSNIMSERMRSKPAYFKTISKDEMKEIHILAKKANTYSYISKESVEHSKKARYLYIKVGPKRICKGCGIEFNQRTAFGHTLYCSSLCYNKSYAKKRKEKKIQDKKFSSS